MHLGRGISGPFQCHGANACEATASSTRRHVANRAHGRCASVAQCDFCTVKHDCDAPLDAKHHLLSSRSTTYCQVLPERWHPAACTTQLRGETGASEVR